MNQSVRLHAVASPQEKIRVVILGGGFAGLNAARALGNRSPFQVTLMDRLNHYTFQPLLYQVATAALGEQDIADPLRSLTSKFANVRVLLGEAQRIDVAARCVHTTAGDLPYDYLLVACGVQTSYFGHEHWEAFAPGLKTLSQATEIRARVLGAFEIAELEADRNAQHRDLTFVIIGGGATGVELAASIAEISRRTLKEDFRAIAPANSRVVLIEAGKRLLSGLQARSSALALRDLEKLGVEVRLNTSVRDIRDGYVILDNERIEAGAVLWAAGVRGIPLATTLGAKLDRRGCIHVEPDCTIAGHPEVFVMGDLAVCPHHKTGQPLSQVANVAAQQGRYFGRTLRRDLGGKPRPPFQYFNKGQMAAIGVGRAICEMGPICFGGFFAWLTWLGIHIYYLSSMSNRFFVFMRWTWSLVTWKRHARVVIPSNWRTYPTDDVRPPRAGDTAA